MSKEKQKELAQAIIKAIDSEECFVFTTPEIIIEIGCGTIADAVGMVSRVIATYYLCQQLINGEN